MASVYTSTPAYIPSPEQIAAACGELDARRLAAFDENAKRRRGVDRRKHKSRRAAANRLRQQHDQSEPLDLEETDQQAWKRFDALALDADERGVLNYHNINRGHDLPYHD